MGGDASLATGGGTGHLAVTVTLAGTGEVVPGEGQGTGHLTVSVALAGAG